MAAAATGAATRQAGLMWARWRATPQAARRRGMARRLGQWAARAGLVLALGLPLVPVGHEGGAARVEAAPPPVTLPAPDELTRTSAWPATLDLATDASQTIFGAEANDESGFSVSDAGDVNGDGWDDLINGAPYADGPAGANAGESYLLFGGRTCQPQWIWPTLARGANASLPGWINVAGRGA